VKSKEEVKGSYTYHSFHHRCVACALKTKAKFKYIAHHTAYFYRGRQSDIDRMVGKENVRYQKSKDVGRLLERMREALDGRD